MSKTEQDKKPLTKRTKKKKTKKDKKKKKKKDKSKIPKGITININVGKSGADPKPKLPKAAKGFVGRATSMRGQRGRGNLSNNSRQAEMNTNIMQNVSGIRSSAMQQGLDLKDLTGNFDVLRRRVDGLGTQVLNVQNQQTAGGIRDTAFQDGVNRAIEDNARRQQQALDIMQGNITREVEDTRESTRLGLQNARQALDAVAQSQLEYRQEVQQGMQNTADRQQQALNMMRESLTQGITRDLDIVRGSINEGLTQNEDTQRALVKVVEGVTAVSRQQDEQARQADETQESMAMLSKGLTNVAQGQYEQGNSVLKLQTDINRGGKAIAGLQADMTRGINAFSTLRNDMDKGMAFLAQQGAMNTEATQQIAGNTGAMEALKDIYGDEFAIEMPPQTPTPSSPPTIQTDSKVSSSVDPQKNERTELGTQPPAETLNKVLGRPSGSKSTFKYKGNPMLDDFFEEVIAAQQDTGKRVNWATKPFIVDLIETQGAKLPQLRNRLAQMNTQRTEDKFFEELDKDRKAAEKKAPKSIKVKTKTKTAKKKDKNKK
tara:strand:+ start:1098 stop:2732 length:1635 start_codon:yes stop_codon:yes gene_type:complete